MSISTLVAQNLLAARNLKKLSQKAVADKASLSVRYVSMLERGERTPPLETLEAIAKALGVSPLDLLQADAMRRSRSSTTTASRDAVVVRRNQQQPGPNR